MALSDVVKTRRDADILLEDGTAVTPLSYQVAIEEGTFQYTPGKADRIVVRDRHAIAGLRKGADPIGQVSFSVHFRQWRSAIGDGSLVEFIDQLSGSAYAAFVSTAGAAFEQPLCDITYTVEGTDHGDSADHVQVLTDVFLEWDEAEGDLDTINVTGEVYGTHTETGPA